MYLLAALGIAGNEEFLFLCFVVLINLNVTCTCWQLSESQVLHGSGGDQWFLRIQETMGQGVHSDMKVCDVHPHGLFTHSRLICVTGGLKVNDTA